MGGVGDGDALEGIRMAWQQSPEHVGATTQARASSRRMRREMTPAEQRLWTHLRQSIPAASGHFRRQFAIGPYVADFVHLGARLIVEVDGDHHGHDAQAAHDRERDEFLARQRFCVLRVSNRAVFTEIDGDLEAIASELATATPTPALPARGRVQEANPNR